jgi:ribosomal protein L1
MPSPVSITVNESIQKAVETLKMRVNLGFEYKLHRNWAGCH